MVLAGINAFYLFAQDGGGESPGLPSMLLPMVAIGFLFYFMLIRPEKKKQRERQELLAQIKKNDRVVTTGGIYGVVTNVQRENDEVTLKVDEATNTKIRVTFASIMQVITEEERKENANKS